MKIKKGDLIIIVILIASLLAWFSKDLFLADSGSNKAVIKVDGEIYKTINLEKSEKKEIYSIELPDENYIQVITEDGQIWIEDASCPDQVCIDTGKITRRGQSIVCLPNKTVVFIEGIEGNDENFVDDVSN